MYIIILDLADNAEICSWLAVYITLMLGTFFQLTVGTAKYIMMTLEIALAFRKSDMAPVIIPPAETQHASYCTTRQKIDGVQI